MKQIIFRADANTAIGMGHIMRTLSIADAFTSLGHKVRFILADDSVSKLVESRGYEATTLHSRYDHMDEEKWSADIHADYLIVDSYFVTQSYLSALQEKMHAAGGKLIYLDDVYTFPYPVDILIDYNAYATQAIYDRLYKGAEQPHLILGPTYAPLRSMFRGITPIGANISVKHYEN